MAIEMKILILEVYWDSKLVINQLLIEYEVRNDDLIPYYMLATQLLQRFDVVALEHIPRKENQMADAFANLASNIELREGDAVSVPVCQRWVVPLITKSTLEDANIIYVLPIDTEE